MQLEVYYKDRSHGLLTTLPGGLVNVSEGIKKEDISEYVALIQLTKSLKTILQKSTIKGIRIIRVKELEEVW